VNEFFNLFLDGFDDSGMAVTGGIYSNASSKIQKAVAVHIPYFRSFTVIHDKGIAAGVGWRNNLFITFNHPFGVWSW